MSSIVMLFGDGDYTVPRNSVHPLL